MVVCGECGAENRDRARFCRGCTQPLVAVTVVDEPDTVAEVPGLPPADGGAPRKKSTRPCPACKAPNPRRSLSCLACGEPLGQRRKALNASKAEANDQGAAPDASSSVSAPVVPASSRAAPARVYWKLAAVLLAVGVVVWWYSAFRAQLPSPPPEVAAQVAPVPSAQQPAAASSPQAEPSVSTVPTLTPSADAVNADGTPAVTQLSQAIEEVRLREERKEAERLAAQEKARAARIAERQRAQEARLQAAREAAAAAAAAAAAPPPPAPVVAAPAPAPAAPPPPKTVAQLCAGATNFLARDFCRIEACQQAANVNDAICVSYRRMDAERRARMAN